MRWIVALLLLLPLPALACGPDSRCEVEGGYYLASPPPDWDGESALPVMVYFHGWNGSPEGTFRNKAMVNGVNARFSWRPMRRTGIGARSARGGPKADGTNWPISARSWRT